VTAVRVLLAPGDDLQAPGFPDHSSG